MSRIVRIVLMIVLSAGLQGGSGVYAQSETSDKLVDDATTEITVAVDRIQAESVERAHGQSMAQVFRPIARQIVARHGKAAIPEFVRITKDAEAGEKPHAFAFCGLLAQLDDERAREAIAERIRAWEHLEMREWHEVGAIILEDEKTVSAVLAARVAKADESSATMRSFRLLAAGGDESPESTLEAFGRREEKLVDRAMENYPPSEREIFRTRYLWELEVRDSILAIRKYRLAAKPLERRERLRQQHLRLSLLFEGIAPQVYDSDSWDLAQWEFRAKTKYDLDFLRLFWQSTNSPRRDKEAKVAMAIAALSRMTEATADFEKFTRSEKPKLREWGYFCLYQLPGPESAKALERSLCPRHPLYEHWLGEHLGRYGDKQTLAVLERWAADEHCAIPKEQLDIAAQGIRVRLTRAERDRAREAP